MHFSSAVLLLSSALAGVSLAHTGRFHNHQQLHEKKALDASPDALIEVRDRPQFKKAGKPAKTTSKIVAPTPTPTPKVAPAAAAVDTPSTGGTYQPFCGGEKATSKRATLAQIAYAGNTGRPGKWGCNMMIIDASIVSLYDYTTKFSSTGGTWTCSCFNKIGPNGGIDGFWFSAVSFTISAGQTKYMAFEANSQGGCACGPGSSTPKTAIGQLAGSWLEFDWGNESNGGNSGADASVLVAGAAGLPYYGMSVKANGNSCSWVKSDGTNHDAYMPGMEDADGVGCKGYYKGNLDVALGD